MLPVATKHDQRQTDIIFVINSNSKAKDFAIFPGKKNTEQSQSQSQSTTWTIKQSSKTNFHMNNNRNQPPIVNLVPAMEETMNRKRRRKLLIKLKRKRIEGERERYVSVS